ncbi:unnamed protein product [Pleuronectes platessa]|uniref:Uncharacterized protein n=1 Tax=Pleuronectes platessa TaxID=8262 RepID=A0A9N7TGD4_PLEPL|nr:unnamed protein product [Pleuronectes platessa]
MKPKYLSYRGGHLVLVTSLGARVYRVVIVVCSREDGGRVFTLDCAAHDLMQGYACQIAKASGFGSIPSWQLTEAASSSLPPSYLEAAAILIPDTRRPTG